MKENNTANSFVSHLLNALPPSMKLSIMSWVVSKRYDAPGVVLPYSLGASPQILVILPPDELAATHQAKSCLALATHFPNAKITVVCSPSVTPFFKALGPIQNFIEYDGNNDNPFSKELGNIGKTIHESQFDACVLLDPDPKLSLLYLCGKSSAPVRIGFATSNASPFLNMQVKPSGKLQNCAERGLLVASMLGASAPKKAKWGVSKEALAELKLQFGEMKIDATKHLVGVDAFYFAEAFGFSWTKSLLDTIAQSRGSCYLYVNKEPSGKAKQWLAGLQLPVFSNLSAPRSAALVYVSSYIIAGATTFFQLADILHKPVIGIFSNSQYDAYCTDSETTRGIRFDTVADERVIDAVKQNIDVLTLQIEAR